MPVDRQTVLEALKKVKDPDLGADLVGLDMVKDLEVGETTRVRVEIANPSRARRAQIEAEVRAAVAGVPGVSSVQVEVGFLVPSTKPPMGSPVLPQVKNIVAVASGKGGVGKSTVAVNLAAALAAEGASVGLLDADIYGPSVPALMGLAEKPTTDGQKLHPPARHGMKFMSMGLLVEQGQSVIWRGPMLHGVLKQFLEDVHWGELDYLIVDLPPGTGDVQLSLCQTVPIGGAVVVSTPQDVALNVAVKAINMFEKLNTPVVGVVENMSYYVCPHCGERDDVFGHGGAEEASAKMNIPFLGGIPLERKVRQSGDHGEPVVLSAPDSPAAKALVEAARLLAGRLTVAAIHGYEDLLATMPRG